MRKYHLNFLMSILTIGAVYFVTFFFFSCGGNDGFKTESYEKIESMTSSNIKRLDDIKIVFTDGVKYKDKVNQAIVFTPKLEGLGSFVDDRTFVFHPSSPYKGMSEIKMSVDVSLLFDGRKGEAGFIKNFIVSPPSLFVQMEPLKIKGEGGLIEIDGQVETDIPYTIEELTKLFSIKREDGKSVDASLELAQGSSSTNYLLNVKGIKKEEGDFNLLVEYDGSSIGAQEKASTIYQVLSKNVFEIVSHRVEDGNTVAIYFSDLVDKSTSIISYVVVKSNVSFNCSAQINDNVIRLRNNIGNWPDGCKVTVAKGIFSKYGESATKKEYSFVIKDSWDIPKVSFETRGNIVPSKDNASIFIKTRNIKGIYMRAINIYGQNMLQFLQEGGLSTSYNLEPVGESVWEGSFEFEWKEDMKNRDVVRELDITELVKKFPTGMFNLQIAFSKKDSMYVPKNSSEDFSHLPFPEAKFYKTSWQAYNAYWEEHSGEVERDDFWEQNDNPSHPAFYLQNYNYELVARQGILVSNIALMAKKDNENSLYARVCDIRTGKAVQGAEVKAFSFAQREIAKGRTDGEGFIVFKDIKDVAFIQASKDDSFSYLKLRDGAEISTGHFEVDGQVSKEGLKGYIYGERGIWRPGDDIHLNFILQDSKNTLPKDIPVEFTLQDPMFTQIDRQVFNSSVGGIYRIDTKTDVDGKTGYYTARVKIGGNTWTKQLKVEAIIPNRLFVEMEIQDYLKSGKNNIVLSSQWLHGALASNLNAEVDCTYYLNRKPFEGWSQYSFIASHESSSFSTATERLWKGTLDGNGKANINVPMNVTNAPGRLKATFETRVYEGSGAFSVENKTFDFSPYPAYVGIMLPEGEDSYRERMLYTNKDNTVNIVVVDKDGKLIKSNRALKLDVYRLEWKWWWQDDAYGGAESLYSSSSSVNSVLSSRVYAEGGKGEWKFNINDEDWGRYLLVVKDEEGGHSASTVFYVDTPYWSRRSSGEENIAETILQMQRGKDKYNVGEDVEVTFPSAKDSFAYITLEKGGRVLENRVIEGNGGMCKYTFKATSEMSPNVYVHISLVQPYKNVKNSLPIRLYGIMNVNIEDSNTHLEPVIITEDSFESNKKTLFKVKEKNGRKMAFTVAVVDEGLLGLTSFRQANPWNHFYRKEASSLASYDMFNSISGAFAGRIESLLAIGGSDEATTGDGSKKAERFKSVAMLLGPYELNEKEEKTIEFDMPQYMGAVRLMLVATEGVSYGMEEKTVKVTNPIIVLPTFPRTFGVGETMEVPVTVFNGSSSSVSVKLKLKAEGAIKLTEEKTINIPAMGNEIVSFNVKAEKKGKSIFNIEGSTKGAKDTSTVEIDSISRGTPYIAVTNMLLDAGAQEDLSISLPGESEERQLFVEVSRLPSLGIENRLSFLLSKPYSCLEQYISKAFSSLYLPIFMELDEEDAEKRKERITFALKKLPAFQTSQGGFSYWPSEKEPSLWMSIYAGHFMSEAKKMGFSVEESLYNRFLDYSTEKAKNWTVGFRNDPDLQAYRLYVLALAGRAELQAMNKLKSVNDLSPLAKSLLAASYIITGKKDVGKELAKGVSLSFAENKQGLSNYGSTVRDVAMKLQTYTLLEERTQEVNDCIKALANISSSGEYLSSNEIAWIFIALSPYYNYKKSATITCDVLTKGEKQEITLNKTSKVVRLKVSEDKMQSVRVKNNNTEPIYIALTAKSILTKEEESSFESGGLSLRVSYTDLKLEGISNPYGMKKGDRFFVVLQAKNNSNARLDDLLLNVPIPTGWEITNRRVAGDPTMKSTLVSNDYSYRDFTDTNVYTYFSLNAGEQKQFVLEGTQVYQGSYRIPSMVLESMYNPTRRAVVKN